MSELERLKGMARRLERAIELAERSGGMDWSRALVMIRDGALMGRTDRGTNVARLYDRERKMQGR